jgi:pyridinium-3,5-bisthiocarboxylic acid mononucleotide nickel chelatase
MTIAYFDCFGGISGDMTLGALVDAGAERSLLDATVEALGLGDEVRVTAAREERGHLGGTRVGVEIIAERSRTLPELEGALAVADASEAVRSRALDALRRLGAAESELHATPPESLHLHELGGADTLVDLLGAFWLLESLGVDEVFASPLPAPRGARGQMPLPAPASLRVLAETGASFEPSDAGRELVTPTGAAILAAAARFERPGLQLRSVGYGFGAHPAATNALAVWIGEPAAGSDVVEVLETNVDDMTPADLAAVADELMAAGALDVTITPTLMKKGRPGHALAVMAAPARTASLAQLLLARSTTLGLRVTRAPRVLAGREVITVETDLGPARVKVKRWAGAVDVAAEHDDVRALAAATGRDLRSVRRMIEDAARTELGGV